MKTFIYKEIKHPNKTRNNRELTIYKMNNNAPVYIGTVEFSTGSTRGAIHEAFNYLMNNGYIPKKYYYSSECDWMGAGYFFGDVTKIYRIIEI
jgi:hypothetical protein